MKIHYYQNYLSNKMKQLIQDYGKFHIYIKLLLLKEYNQMLQMYYKRNHLEIMINII
jgi:hypothetical protein